MHTPSLTSAAALALLAGLCPAGALAEPTVFTIDNDHTHVVWDVDRFGFTKTVGTFTDVSGEIHWDEAEPGNSRVVARIAVASLRSDLPAREESVRSRHWLNAEAAPVIAFASTAVVPREAAECPGFCADVTGELTLNGVTVPVTFAAVLNKAGTDPVSKRPALGFSAQGALMRSAFGIETAMALIGDDVRIRLEVLAIGGTTRND
ncbi:MAG: YceI family protein [Pseudomonadota bacterium]